MLKPPFTMLILKNSQQPVTVRITLGVILSVVGLLTFAGFFFGSAASYFTLKLYGGTSSTPSDSLSSTHVPVPLDEQSDITFDILGISVKRLRSGETEVTLQTESIPSERETYIWLIAKPDSDAPGDLFVYPRNPLFKGLPVDFRNGVPQNFTEDNHITVMLPIESENILLTTFRVLIYSTSGEIIADKYFSESNLTKT